jgi:hypothetical protein
VLPSEDQFLRFFADLPVKIRMIESANPALKGYRALREIKEPSRDA